MKNFFINSIIFTIICCTIVACTEQPIPNLSVIIPQPAQQTALKGHFTISEKTTLYTNLADNQKLSPEQWLSEFNLTTGTSAQADNSLNLIINSNTTNSCHEAYTLNILPSAITIEATNPKGLFYGIQSLLQLYNHYGNTLPCVSIDDYPQSTHRGFAMGISNRILSVDFIKKQIDIMANYKMNDLYWTIKTDSINYTHEAIDSVVMYASQRAITIVPTIKTSLSRASISEDTLTNLLSHFSSEYLYITNSDTDHNQGPQCKRCYKPSKDSLQNTPQAKFLGKLKTFTSRKNIKLLTVDSVVIGVNLGVYQNDPTIEPEALTGFLSTEMVYAFKPKTTDSLGRMSICATLDTDLINSNSAVEYMLYPRLFAVAETAWSRPERRSYLNFKRRVAKAVEVLRTKGYTTFDITTENSVRREFIEPKPNIARGKTIYHHIMYDDQYPATGKDALIDGEHGGWSYNDTRWQGYQGSGINTTIDLQAPTKITSISATFMQDRLGRIWLPHSVEISISDDGKEFKPLRTIASLLSPDTDGYHLVSLGWNGDEIETRYIRYIAKPNKRSRSWIFTDEITIK